MEGSASGQAAAAAVASPAALAVRAGAVRKPKPKRRSGPKSKSSPFVGVTQYKRTGHWEAHIWIQNPKGKGHQRHLGSYETADEAARCYDRACLKLRGEAAELNFPRSDYEQASGDPFMKEHERTDKMRFLDVLRAKFALKTGGNGGSAGQPRPTRPAAALRRPRSSGSSSEEDEDEEDEDRAVPASPRTRTVVRAPLGSMAVAAAAVAGGGRVTVHQPPPWAAVGAPARQRAPGGAPAHHAQPLAREGSGVSQELINVPSSYAMDFPLVHCGPLGVGGGSLGPAGGGLTPCSSPGGGLLGGGGEGGPSPLMAPPSPGMAPLFVGAPGSPPPVLAPGLFGMLQAQQAQQAAQGGHLLPASALLGAMQAQGGLGLGSLMFAGGLGGMAATAAALQQSALQQQALHQHMLQQQAAAAAGAPAAVPPTPATLPLFTASQPGPLDWPLPH